MLKRIADVRRGAGTAKAGGVLVKRPKPGQDIRVDLPAIGPSTIENITMAGLSGVAVMAGHVLAAERERMIAMAEASNVFVAGMASRPYDSTPPEDAQSKVGWLGSVPVQAPDADDIRRGVDILAVASAFDVGTAVVVDRRRPMAVGTGEAPSDVINRAAEFRKGDRRHGVAVIAPSRVLDDCVLSAADRCRLAGVGVVRGTASAKVDASVIQLANRLGMFIAETGGFSRDGAGRRG